MSSSVPIPFSEPPWLMGLPSPYYNASHRKWQKTCRALVSELLYDAAEWEKQGDVPGTYQSSNEESSSIQIPNVKLTFPSRPLPKVRPGKLPDTQSSLSSPSGMAQETGDHTSTRRSPSGRIRLHAHANLHRRDGTIRVPGSCGRRHHGLLLWHSTDPKIRKPSPPRAVPPRHPHRQEENLHRHHRAGSRERRQRHRDHRAKERRWDGMDRGWIQEMDHQRLVVGLCHDGRTHRGSWSRGPFPPCRSAAQSPRCHDAPDKGRGTDVRGHYIH